MRVWAILSAAFLGGHALAGELLLSPYRANGWADDLTLPAHTAIPLAADERPGVCDLFLRVDALCVRIARRARAHALWTALNREDAPPPTDEAWRFELVWLGRRYPFDEDGRFAVDRRFVRPEDNEVIARFEQFYRARLAALNLHAKPPPRPKPKPERPPVFAGFEAPRYQEHDALIARLVHAFNADPAAWAGADEGVAVDIPKLSPALIKSLMIEETGGNGERSLAAWACDPLQINVPGDWAEEKAALGLDKPTARNEGTLEQNLRAGIQFLVRKGFGASGRAIAHRPDAYFDSWREALQRYNGRKDLLPDGRPYNVAYAERVLRRARHPDEIVPIASDHP